MPVVNDLGNDAVLRRMKAKIELQDRLLESGADIVTVTQAMKAFDAEAAEHDRQQLREARRAETAAEQERLAQEHGLFDDGRAVVVDSHGPYPAPVQSGRGPKGDDLTSQLGRTQLAMGLFR